MEKPHPDWLQQPEYRNDYTEERMRTASFAVTEGAARPFLDDTILIDGPGTKKAEQALHLQTIEGDRMVVFSVVDTSLIDSEGVIEQLMFERQIETIRYDGKYRFIIGNNHSLANVFSFYDNTGVRPRIPAISFLIKPHLEDKPEVVKVSPTAVASTRRIIDINKKDGLDKELEELAELTPGQKNASQLYGYYRDAVNEWSKATLMKACAPFFVNGKCTLPIRRWAEHHNLRSLVNVHFNNRVFLYNADQIDGIKRAIDAPNHMVDPRVLSADPVLEQFRISLITGRPMPPAHIHELEDITYDLVQADSPQHTQALKSIAYLAVRETGSNVDVSKMRSSHKLARLIMAAAQSAVDVALKDTI
jgi:hypothetical protein